MALRNQYVTGEMVVNATPWKTRMVQRFASAVFARAHVNGAWSVAASGGTGSGPPGAAVGVCENPGLFSVARL